MATQWNSGLTERSAGFSVTAAEWNKVIQNMNFLAEVGQTSRSTDVSITATTVGTANQILTLGAITYLNVPHVIELFCPAYNGPAQETRFILLDGTTVIGTIGRVGASAITAPLFLPYRFTPSAASHTYNIAAWLGGAGTGTVNSGSGGTAGDATTDLNTWMRIYRVPT